MLNLSVFWYYAQPPAALPGADLGVAVHCQQLAGILQGIPADGGIMEVC